MVDIYAFPHISRLFYLKDSAANKLYEELKLEDKYIFLFRWFNEIRARPELNNDKDMLPISAFHHWLKEL